jgi:hypothetical protein
LDHCVDKARHDVAEQAKLIGFSHLLVSSASLLLADCAHVLRSVDGINAATPPE